MEVIRDVFDDVFVLNKDSCFISPYWQKKQIKKYVSGKTKLGEKMNDFSKQLAHASRPTMESVIENSEKCQRSVSKLLSKFEDMGILRRVRRKRRCMNIYAVSLGGRRCFGMEEMG